jgi:hypothetical protein
MKSGLQFPPLVTIANFHIHIYKKVRLCIIRYHKESCKEVCNLQKIVVPSVFTDFFSIVYIY